MKVSPHGRTSVASAAAEGFAVLQVDCWAVATARRLRDATWTMWADDVVAAPLAAASAAPPIGQADSRYGLGRSRRLPAGGQLPRDWKANTISVLATDHAGASLCISSCG
jgi:hypothetical protein